MMTVVQWVRWASEARKTAMRVAALVGAGFVINSAVVRSSTAQIAALPQPTFTLTDENSVDMLSFNAYLKLTDLSIGSKEQPLTHTLSSGQDAAPGGEDQYNYSFVFWQSGITHATCNPNGTLPYVWVVFGNASEYFQGCITFAAITPTGSTLTYNSDGTYSYAKRDGTTVLFSGDGTASQGAGPPKQILYPDGRVLTYWYYNDGSGAPLLKSVTRSDGLQLKYTYTKITSSSWATTSVTAINNAYEYCNPTAACSLKMAWPTANYSFTVPTSGVGNVITITDAAGRVTRYTEDGQGRTVGIKLPSSASADNITYTYCDSNCPQYAFEGFYLIRYQDYVLKVIRDGHTWSYSGNPGSPTATQCGTSTYGFTNPVGSGKHVSLYNCLPNTPSSPTTPGFNPFIQLTDEDGVEYIGGTPALIKNVIKPEGNQTGYLWDPRGNLTQETLLHKPWSALDQVVLSANYDTTCTIPVKCNKPNWVKDGLLNETDYTYDPTHGGVLTATLPADANGIRPQTRYTYTQRYAWVLNASGTYVQSAAPIWVLATESSCRTRAASTTGTGCTVAGDEVVKTYEYGPNSGPNNLFLRGVAVTADGVTHRTCYGYDPYGNKISETEPAAGLTSCP
jgi:YD repeat-containing protein